MIHGGALLFDVNGILDIASVQLLLIKLILTHTKLYVHCNSGKLVTFQLYYICIMYWRHWTDNVCVDCLGHIFSDFSVISQRFLSDFSVIFQ